MTRKPNAADAESVGDGFREALRQCLAQAGVEPSCRQPVLVAFSGGVDSTVLLHSAAQLWQGAVVAVHVNHGLQHAADHFEADCVAVCSKWNIPIRVRRLDLRVNPGDSLEEVARQGRYHDLAEVAQAEGAVAVLLGQHANDQLETLLIALSRGAGVPGLAGMPVQRKWHGQLFLRPWLSVPATAIRNYALKLGLPFVEDPSNSDLSFTRNRIRELVIPSLLEMFPSLLDTAGRSARHCAQAADLLDEQAKADLGQQTPLRLDFLRSLSIGRQANVLRYWLRAEGARAPSAKQLDQLMQQIQRASTRAHRLDVPISDGRVQRVGAELVYIHRSVASRVNHRSDEA